MNVGSYRGAAALAAYEQWQEITSQNIASGSVPGFKKTEVSFTCSDGGKTKLPGAASQEAAGTVPKLSSSINLMQGQITSTGNGLDTAIRGDGFFEVRRPDGSMAYTRNGGFQLNATGGLMTKDGNAVMGNAGPISAPGTGPVTITAQGEVQQNDETVGKLALYNASDPKQIAKIGGGLFVPADPAVPFKPVAGAEVVSGSIESSNVAPLSEMVNLITVSRAYEANQKVITTNDDETDKAIQALGNS